MNIHFLQHVPFEGPGYLQTWVLGCGHQFSVTRFFEPADQLPIAEQFDALIVLGGPMGVYDELQYPWLSQEKEFITEAIVNGKKVVGICLGAQLAAVCLGAKVTAATNKEMGWYPVLPTKYASQVSWFNVLFSQLPIAFHWHGDAFETPIDAIPLLYSMANANQAFIYNDQVIGLQFHLEATPETLAQLLENCSGDLTVGSYIQDRETILRQLNRCGEINKIAERLLNHFFDVRN